LLALSLVGALLVGVPNVLAQGQPAQAPADSSAPTAEPIGNVAAVTGIATVIRNKNSLPLHVRDDVFLNDAVQTSSSSSLAITFNDATTFHLSANAKITIDNYVYEDGGKQNTGIFAIGKGTVAFVAAAVARTGDMRIATPTSTLGIRGTTGLVEVPESGGAAGSNVTIKLYPDADGHVGRIEVNDRTGVRLGTMTQGASGFAIRPGVGRATAVPLTISPREAVRDQGFVRRVHAAQTVGRQIVTEQRAARRSNPNAPNRGNQPLPQRQSPAPGQNRPGQRGAPNRQEQQQQNQPGRPSETKPNTKRGAQPATPQRERETGKPRPAQPGAGQNAAHGLHAPATPNRPAQLRARPPAQPRGKRDKEKR
jgi:hypothetical protein